MLNQTTHIICPLTQLCVLFLMSCYLPRILTTAVLRPFVWDYPGESVPEG